MLPDNFRFDYSGPSREFKQAGSSILLIFGLALAFIYLLLAAQFESFLSPLLIMVTVPLSMAGAFLAIHLTGGTLNVYSQIGLVTLIGLITKHGILIVEFANKALADGCDPARRGAAGGRAAPAPDPDDHGGHGAGGGAAGPGARCRCREPAADRLGDRRRHDAWARC